jgi:hypothetical protein
LRQSFDIYLKGAAGAIIVEDYRKLKGKESVKKLQEWRDLLLQKTSLSDGRPIPTILLLNKSDMPMESTIEVVTEESRQPASEEKVETGGGGEGASKSDQDDASRVSGNTAEITRHIEGEEQKGDSISESQSESDFFGDILESFKVNGIYNTSAKDGKNVKVAVACLVREILKEGSFINRVDSQGSFIADANPRNNKNGNANTNISSQGDLQKPNIQV